MKNFLKAEVQGRPLTKRDGCMLFALAFFLLFLFWLLFVPQGYSRHSAKRAACLSNLKQIGIATELYASDNSDSLPPFLTTMASLDGQGAFVAALAEYTKSTAVWLCPETPKVLSSGGFSGIEGSGKTSFVTPMEFAKHIATVDSYRVADIPDPANLPYLRDPIRSIETDEASLLIRSGHGLKFNLLFTDGHAKVVEMNRDGLKFSRQ